MKTKQKNCLYCKDIFEARWNNDRGHFSEYCPKCVKAHVWWKKSRPFLGKRKIDYISDEGVVIYAKD